MPEFGGIAHLDLTVSDAEASSDWYSTVLGLQRLSRTDLDNRIMIAHRNPATGMIICLNQHRSPAAEKFDERRPGLDHIGFAVSERVDLDAWQARFAELGVVHSPVTDTPSGSGTALVFRDPDNIQLEFWWSPRT